MLRYFTGRPCKYGHFDERRTSIGHCVTCLRLIHERSDTRLKRRAHYLDNRERMLQEQRAYKESLGPEIRKGRKRADYERHRTAYIERMRLWRQADPDRSRALNRSVYFKNHEYNQLRNRAWALDNVDRAAAVKAHKRAVKRQATPSLWRDLTVFVHEEALDLARTRERLFGFKWHVDHMVPLKSPNFVGLHIWYNLQVIPAWLNLMKGNRLIFTEPFTWLGDATK